MRSFSVDAMWKVSLYKLIKKIFKFHFILQFYQNYIDVHTSTDVHSNTQNTRASVVFQPHREHNTCNVISVQILQISKKSSFSERNVFYMIFWHLDRCSVSEDHPLSFGVIMRITFANKISDISLNLLFPQLSRMKAFPSPNNKCR